MGNEYYKDGYRPLLPGTKRISFNSFEDLEQITKKTAAIFIEPVQGEAGIISPEKCYLKAVRDKCNQMGTLLVFDEIQTGFGRTGQWFASKKYNVVPDILLLAKGMAGGMPLGAFISSKEIMNVFKDNPILGHITTFGGHPVSCAAALACIEVLESSNYIAEVIEKEAIIHQVFSDKNIKEVRTNGLMAAIELDSFETVQKTMLKSMEKGVLIDWFLFCNTAVRIAPPLTISTNELQEACEIVGDCIV